MTQDKQLRNVVLGQVIEKRRLDQALNTKEFAVLAGVSYSCARAWFRQPGFPAISGVVFWQDFLQWRTAKTGLLNVNEVVARNSECHRHVVVKPSGIFTGKAARLLAECGGQN
jgi:hypothetical protein